MQKRIATPKKNRKPAPFDHWLDGLPMTTAATIVCSLVRATLTQQFQNICPNMIFYAHCTAIKQVKYH